MNVNDLFMYTFLFIIVCIVILCVIKFNKNRKTKKVKIKPKVTEKFRSTINMDEVLDKYCVDKPEFPEGINNYLGPWDNEDGKCSFYECPNEYCYILEPSFDNNYRYVKFQSPEERSNDSDGASYCISKAIGNSNIFSCSSPYMELNKPETCGDTSPIDSWYFDTSSSNWRPKKINKFYNSNGECIIKNVNYPYDEVYYIELNDGYLPGSTFTKQTIGNSSNTPHYSKKGISCEMKMVTGVQSGESNYWIPIESSSFKSDNPYLELIDNRIESFDGFFGGFKCKNGNIREYSYITNPKTGKMDGLKCGFLDENDNCKSCYTAMKKCFDFDSNQRSWSTRNYIRTDKLQSVGSENDCKIYKVNAETEVVDVNQLNDSGYLRDILGHIENDDDGYSYNTDNKNYVTVSNDDPDFTCLTTDYSSICGKDVKCKMLGANIYKLIDENLTTTADTSVTNKDKIFDKIISNKSDLVNIEQDDDKNLMYFYLDLKEVFKSDGSNCENCFIDSDGECIKDLNFFTKTDTMCDESCPNGTEFKGSGGMSFKKEYCRKCTNNEYYDDKSKKCIPFSGCPSGTYFDPSSNIEVKLFDQTNEYPNLYEAIQNNKKLEDLYFLNDNDTDSNCKPCLQNTFMSEIDHTNTICNTCELIQDSGTIGGEYLYTVNRDKTTCRQCIANTGDDIDDGGYVKNDGGTYSCEICADLANEHVDKEKARIFGRTPKVITDDDILGGNCYKLCKSGSFSRKYQKIQEIEMKNNIYSNCSFECAENYYLPSGSNQCFPCPVGQQLSKQSTDSVCTSCPDGYYNDEPGTSCKLCPKQNNDVYQNKIQHSIGGASNIRQCYYYCLSNDDSGNESTEKAFFNGTKRYVNYDFDSCPQATCFAGYSKENLPENTGYKYTARLGEINISKVDGSCELPQSLTSRRIQTYTNASCEKNFEETKLYNQGSSISNVVCCTAGLKYNSESNICKCPAKPTGSTVISGYTWNGSGCMVQCEGDAVRQFDNSCLTKCSDGEYALNSTCTACPNPSTQNENNPTLAYNTDGKDIKGCYFRSCPSGYYLPSGGISRFDGSEYVHDCIELTQICEFYEDTNITANTIGNNKIKDFGDYGGSLITLQKYVTSSIPRDECIGNHTSNDSINDPYMLDYDNYKRGYCSGTNNIQEVKYKQKFYNGVFQGEELITDNDDKAIFCCPSGSNGSMGYSTDNTDMKYKCCPNGQKIFIDSTNIVTCANYNCPPPDSIQNYIYYSDTAKSSISDETQFLKAPLSNCRIECMSSFRWNETENECSLRDICDPLYEYQENLSDSNIGLSVYKLEDKPPSFSCKETGEYYDKLSKHSCIQKVDEQDGMTLQYCCPSGFTYDEVENNCMRTFTVCHGD